MRSKVVFVASPSSPQSGSTLLRGHQLRQLAAPLLEARGVEAITADHAGFRDAILILGKSALRSVTPSEIALLRRSGNVVCADPLDGRVKRGVLQEADILIAASTTQLHAFRRRFRAKKVIHVAHHVDLRIEPVTPRADAFRMGYFGELENARFAEELAGTVAFVNTDTSNATDTGWMRRLPEYNAHYALRRSRSIDGHKPFTKGFVAAHCQCPILVSADDREARSLLGPDYPYYTAGDSPDQARAAILRMREGFGGAEWLRALAAMRRLQAISAPAAVARQLYEGIAPEIAGRRRSPVGNLVRNLLLSIR